MFKKKNTKLKYRYDYVFFVLLITFYLCMKISSKQHNYLITHMSSEAAQKVKAGLATRGISGIASLGIAFRNFDTDGNRKLARDEFNYGL